MKTERIKYTVAYRVLHPSGRTLEVLNLTGPNKAYLKWKAERIVTKRYGKGNRLEPYRTAEEPS